jgi:FlaA1/EpsC-like NDP-sugar epimerase
MKRRVTSRARTSRSVSWPCCRLMMLAGSPTLESGRGEHRDLGEASGLGTVLLGRRRWGRGRHAHGSPHAPVHESAATASLQRPWWLGLAQRSLRGPGDLLLALLDIVLVSAAFTVMLIVRYEFAVSEGIWDGFGRFVVVAVALQLAANRLAGLYGPVWQHASIAEAQRILAAGVATTSLLFGWQFLAAEKRLPLSVIVSGGLVATLLMGALRFHSRLFAFHRRQRADAIRVLVVGAGHSAASLLREIDRSPDGDLEVVALLDDDPRKVGRSMGATAIVGTIDDLQEAGRDYRADLVILAIPSAGSPLVRRVADEFADLGVPLKVLPSVAEMMNGEPQLHDVRDLSIDDLLGRQPIATDLDSVAAMIRGRRVLVTGGGGSIGSEIVRQVAEYQPSELYVLDRDETHLFDALAAIGDRGSGVLMDVRDADRVHRFFKTARPEIVFHAAANKHVPLLEDHPAEAAATNVLGTRNVVAAARANGVEHFVFVSTDKAVQPSNVMGASKHLGEQLVLAHAPEGSAWCAVRFGNVLGSRGSVVPTFLRQIREGGPVTLTHADVTRFFMSIPEAVMLVLQAAALADDRQIFMLEMGEPVRIADLARRMISLAGLRVGTDVEIQVTGLRPGEKLAEELYTLDEQPTGTVHPKIFQLKPQVLSLHELVELTARLTARVACFDDGGVRDLLLQDLPNRRILRAVDGSRSSTPSVLERVHLPAATEPAPASALHQ